MNIVAQLPDENLNSLSVRNPARLAVVLNGANVEVEDGVVTLLKHWCVEDCGRIINPQLVDEQIRGGLVQGLGGALFEEIHYDEVGQLLYGSMADYLVPMAAEMPDMVIGHVETPTK